MAQQRKPMFSLACKILKELCNLPSKNIPFFQNADSQFLMNTEICSILTLFTSCKHRHQYYSVYTPHPNFRLANFLIFSKHLWSRDPAPMKQSLELHRVSRMTNHYWQVFRLSFFAFTKGKKRKGQSFCCILVI